MEMKRILYMMLHSYRVGRWAAASIYWQMALAITPSWLGRGREEERKKEEESSLQMIGPAAVVATKQFSPSFTLETYYKKYKNKIEKIGEERGRAEERGGEQHLR